MVEERVDEAERRLPVREAPIVEERDCTRSVRERERERYIERYTRSKKAEPWNERQRRTDAGEDRSGSRGALFDLHLAVHHHEHAGSERGYVCGRVSS